MASADVNNIKLTDHNNNPREPYQSINVVISNTRVDDVITVYLDAGDGTPDKDTYTSHSGSVNVQNNSVFYRLPSEGNFPIDTPSAGTFIIVDTSAKEEHRYRYTAWATNELTLPTVTSGTTTSGSFYYLGATGNPFSSGVQRGDIIRNVTDGGWCYVTAVTDNNNLATTPLSDGGSWAASKEFKINALIETYNENDTFFIPYMDTIEDTGTEGSPGSETVNILYNTDRNVVIRVRNVENATPMQPFVATNTSGDTGVSVPVIRTEDEVYA
jgi:hypothetical protein